MEDITKYSDYKALFKKATSYVEPYPFQEKFATGEEIPQLVNVPTGLGKTEMAVLGWLWRRLYANDETRAKTPRRLVYCLPMRVLVEQTRDNVLIWLSKLNLLAGEVKLGENGKVLDYKHRWDEPEKIAVTTLMGGEDNDKWDKYPERDAIIIGTQDMLLSRALNRGYGMSRYRWQMHFGLLNNDCLWVFDEVQLMGAGVTTTSQMQGFRYKEEFRETFGNVQSVWMSATLDKSWLNTVDFQNIENLKPFVLDENELEHPKIKKRREAKKALEYTETKIMDSSSIKVEQDYFKRLCNEVLNHHIEQQKPEPSITLVIVNTVKRAVGLYDALRKSNNNNEIETVLLHSRFRSPDRKKIVDKILEKEENKNSIFKGIIVSTQVVEAGVDLSAKTLFTELAPWASLVQRFGRCNRKGEFDDAKVFIIDFTSDKIEEKNAAPYEAEQMMESRKTLYGLTDVGIANLPDIKLEYVPGQVIRKKDIIELFDTTPNLAGQDIDISRFIRDTKETDVQVFWRDFDNDEDAKSQPQPVRDELCSIQISAVKSLDKVKFWKFEHLDKHWINIPVKEIFPGQTLMLQASAGFYSPENGWDLNSKAKVDIIETTVKSRGEGYGDDKWSESDWQTIAEHSDDVVKKVDEIINNRKLNLNENFKIILKETACWHDVGKAHPAFQAMIKQEDLKSANIGIAAKAPTEVWRKGRLPEKWEDAEGRRKHFRHELVSALCVLQNKSQLNLNNIKIDEVDVVDLIAYLVAAHHGKVRLSIRSMPDEYLPVNPDKTRFARGIWDGDEIPEVEIGQDFEGNRITMHETEMNLTLMELGESEKFGPSWLARMLRLRDKIGIFKLAYLETLIKVADERASAGEK